MDDAATAASKLLKSVEMVEELVVACIDDRVDSDIWLPPVLAQDGNQSEADVAVADVTEANIVRGTPLPGFVTPARTVPGMPRQTP